MTSEVQRRKAAAVVVIAEAMLKEKIKRKENKNKYDFGYFVELSMSPIPSYLKLVRNTGRLYCIS